MEVSSISHVEYFDLDDPSSIEALSKNRKGEEISSASYAELILALLDRHTVITTEFLEQEILRLFGHKFGPSDLRWKRVGKCGRQRKWQNNVDQAQATLTRQGLIYSREATVDKKRMRWIVEAGHARRVLWIMQSTGSRTNRKKRCPRCETYWKQSVAECDCGYVFPEPKARTHKLVQPR